MFWFIKQVFITLLSFSGSLTSMTNASNFTTCIYLSNQPCATRTTPTDLNPVEYN